MVFSLEKYTLYPRHVLKKKEKKTRASFMLTKCQSNLTLKIHVVRCDAMSLWE